MPKKCLAKIIPNLWQFQSWNAFLIKHLQFSEIVTWSRVNRLSHWLKVLSHRAGIPLPLVPSFWWCPCFQHFPSLKVSSDGTIFYSKSIFGGRINPRYLQSSLKKYPICWSQLVINRTPKYWQNAAWLLFWYLKMLFYQKLILISFIKKMLFRISTSKKISNYFCKGKLPFRIRKI